MPHSTRFPGPPEQRRLVARGNPKLAGIQVEAFSGGGGGGRREAMVPPYNTASSPFPQWPPSPHLSHFVPLPKRAPRRSGRPGPSGAAPVGCEKKSKFCRDPGRGMSTKFMIAYKRKRVTSHAHTAYVTIPESSASGGSRIFRMGVRSYKYGVQCKT